MNKTRTTMLLVLSLLLTSMLTVGNVKAMEYLNVNWGHMAPGSGDPELSREEDACVAVANWFVNCPGWDSWYAYGSDTTANNLQASIVYRQTHDTWASDFWVGDFYPEVWNGTMHYNFYGENGGSNNIHDNDLLYWTNYPYSKQHFTFIWTCACGNAVNNPHNQSQYVYGYYDDINMTGFVGMPLGWTSRADLSMDGYHSPDYSSYCYLGWNSTSKGMSANTGNINYDYYWFVYYFYQHLAGESTTYNIHQSLDWASQQIWGLNWDEEDNPLGWGHYYGGEWHWINVYGNSNIALH